MEILNINGESLPHFMSVKDFAEVLKVDEQVVTRACRNGQLKYKKIGRRFFVATASLMEFEGGSND